MPRLIEIVLFLSPFVAFFVWRRFVRTVILPVWFLLILAAFVLAMFGGLLWIRHQAAGDATERYAPAILQGDRIIPGRPVPRP